MSHKLLKNQTHFILFFYINSPDLFAFDVHFNIIESSEKKLILNCWITFSVNIFVRMSPCFNALQYSTEIAEQYCSENIYLLKVTMYLFDVNDVVLVSLLLTLNMICLLICSSLALTLNKHKQTLSTIKYCCKYNFQHAWANLGNFGNCCKLRTFGISYIQRLFLTIIH